MKTYKHILHRGMSFYRIKSRVPSPYFKPVLCNEVADRYLNKPGVSHIRVTVSTVKCRGNSWHCAEHNSSIFSTTGFVDGERHYFLTSVREAFRRLGVTKFWFKVEAL